MEIGLREANQRFSRIVKIVREGVDVVLTDRGKPFARISPWREASSNDSGLRRLEAAGLLRAAAKSGPMPAFKPRCLRGPSMTQTLREERDSS